MDQRKQTKNWMYLVQESGELSWGKKAELWCFFNGQVMYGYFDVKYINNHNKLLFCLLLHCLYWVKSLSFSYSTSPPPQVDWNGGQEIEKWHSWDSWLESTKGYSYHVMSCSAIKGTEGFFLLPRWLLLGDWLVISLLVGGGIWLLLLRNIISYW